MSDAEAWELARVHALRCPSDVGELRKLINGFLLACERAGDPVIGDDEVSVTVKDGAVVLTRIPM
jgi:hypothetical protein